MMLVLSFVYPCNALCPHCPYTNSNIRKEYRDAPLHAGGDLQEDRRRIRAHTAPICGSRAAASRCCIRRRTELLVYAKNVGCKIGLITNGSLFDEENSRALLEAGVDMIEFSVDACDPRPTRWCARGSSGTGCWPTPKRMLRCATSCSSTSKIVVSAVDQAGVDINAVEKYWVEGMGVDYIIKRKFLTWGGNTTLDGRARPIRPPISTPTRCPARSSSSGSISTAAATSWCAATTSRPTPAWAMSRPIHPRHLARPRLPLLSREASGRPGQGHCACAGCPDWKYRSWNHNYWKVVPERRGRARAQALPSGRARGLSVPWRRVAEMRAMSLKLAGHLFTGPFAIDTTEVRANQVPVVYAVVAKGGPSWAPVFRVVDVGASPDEGVRFDDHPRRPDWKGEAGESVHYRVVDAPRSEFTAGDRERIAEELRQRYDPPRGFID